MKHPGRSGPAWESARRVVLARDQVCQICGGEFDSSAGPRSRWAPTVDHILPLLAMRDLDQRTVARLSTDPGNLRAVHLRCNSLRGNQTKRRHRRSATVLRRW